MMLYAGLLERARNTLGSNLAVFEGCGVDGDEVADE
jgi:hypothetical protein